MIEAFSLETAHLYGDALASQARLRYRVFVEREQLQRTVFDGMEYDEYDTPAAVYLVWRDEKHIVRGLVRLIATDRHSTLPPHYPDLVEADKLRSGPDVWEMTRVCVDKDFDPHRRLCIFPELLCAAQEFGLRHGVRYMTGSTRPHLVNLFIGSGVEWLSEPRLIEGQEEAVFLIPTECLRPHRHCAKYGIEGSMLDEATLDDRRLAA